MPHDEIQYSYPQAGGVEVSRTRREYNGALAPHPYEVDIYDRSHQLREVQHNDAQGRLFQRDTIGEEGRLTLRQTLDQGGNVVLRQSFSYHADGSWSSETRDLRVPMARGEGWVASREQHRADGSFTAERFHNDGSGSTRIGHDANGNALWQEVRNRNGELNGQRTEISPQDARERHDAGRSPGEDGVATLYNLQTGDRIEERFHRRADGGVIGASSYLITTFDRENHPRSSWRSDPRDGNVYETAYFDSRGRVVQRDFNNASGTSQTQEAFHYDRDGSWTREVRSHQVNESGSEWQLALREQHSADGRSTVENFNRDGSGQRGHYDSHNNQLWSENFDRSGNRIGERTPIRPEAGQAQGETASENRPHTTAQERQEDGASGRSDKEHKAPPPETREHGSTRH